MIKQTILEPIHHSIRLQYLYLFQWKNKANVKIRFRYEGSWDFWWAVDEVKITGSQSSSITWSPTSGLYTDAGASNAYTGGAATTVYAKPAGTTVYTALQLQAPDAQLQVIPL